MNFAEIENTWRSPQNRPTPAQLEEIKMKFVTDLNKRHRGTVAFMGLLGTALLFMTGRIILHLLWPNPGSSTVNFSEEWALIPFFALPWIGWIIMVRRYRRHRAEHPNYESSIS